MTDDDLQRLDAEIARLERDLAQLREQMRELAESRDLPAAGDSDPGRHEHR